MREVKRIFRELIVVVVLGLVVGFAANSVNTNGLTLSKNYESRLKATPTPQPTPEATATRASDNQDKPPGKETEEPKGGVTPYGFKIIQHDDMVKLFNDFYYNGSPCVIIDARVAKNYKVAHIPGAYNIYHQTYTEEELNRILDLCYSVDKVIVYCTGNECEDSEEMAALLREKGVEQKTIYVYTGGITQWQAENMVCEIGERDSGNLTGGQQ